ncbi:SDR family NAD(P)-dependent oxidoreductase [Trinickia diaoshuihuensis]|jgi:NAD(P)-dependent dehydrogenase (short-subunit alcohol dehydrogenase family)|uniref:SDR family NAD(P)-dependent oxidoreductase n=1 Tax=Trinickia diaoshuihuensis TaxID=2292265 RepID=UPI000E288907|nr:SDR family NAD(P)-dependent oxidoreductase [Trinickia diaoshuihuensis]
MTTQTNPLKDKHAVVTGGGSGIGAAIARTLVDAGARVTLIGRDSAKLEAQRLELGASHAIHCAPADVTHPEDVQGAFASARKALGDIDILINNAGQAQAAPFGKTDLGLWQRMIDVNLTGTFLCTQAALPAMIERGFGRIVNVASTAGQIGYPYVTAYCAAKHGVIGLTRALALETATTGVTVNAVCPGYTETPLLQTSLEQVVAKTGRSNDDARAALQRANPQRRFIEPGEVAHAVLWLVMPESGSVTGQSISISGGEVT